MINNNVLIAYLVLFWTVLLKVSPVSAHTANISSSRIIKEAEAHYRVDVGYLGSDIERMLNENKEALAGMDLTEPGLLDALIGKFIQGRVSLHNEEGAVCASEVVKVGEDPANPGESRASLHFDCSMVRGKIFYNPNKLLEAQGARARHLVSMGAKDQDINFTEDQSIGKESHAGQVMIYAGDKPVEVTEPLLGPWQLAKKFFYAGMEHIVTGYDHLCFLIAVVLWATRVWPVVKIVTAFTLSHSVTLTLAALELVNLPGDLVEIAIAASIIYVAAENFVTRRVESRWKDTFAFGFIHGFGFASGLIELGVPQRAIIPALASFNIGVEVGQIGVILIVMPLFMMIDKYMTTGQRSAKLIYVLSGVISMFGIYWLIERLVINVN